MHLELLGSLWLLNTMRTEPSKLTTNYAVCNDAVRERLSRLSKLTPHFAGRSTLAAASPALTVTRTKQQHHLELSHDNDSHTCATVSSC